MVAKYRTIVLLLLVYSKLIIAIIDANTNANDDDHDDDDNNNGRTTTIQQQSSASCPSSSEIQQQEQQQHHQNGRRRCTLYLAKSSIPNSGLGVYSGMTFKHGEMIEHDHDGVSSGDGVYPIYDIELHNDYQPTPKLKWSVADYTWSVSKFDAEDGSRKQATHSIRNEAKRVTTLVPGLGALANNHDVFANVAFDTRRTPLLLRYNDDDNTNDSSSGSITPYYGLQHRVTTTKIEAGSELFHNYGSAWGESKRRQQMKIPLQIHYDKADQILQCFQKLLTDLNLLSSDDGDGDDDNDDDFTTTSVVIKNIWNYMRSVNKNTTTAAAAAAAAAAIRENEDLGLSKMVNNNETIKLYLREMLINNSSSCHIGEDERTETALNFPYTVAIKEDMHSSALASLHGQTYTRSLEWLEEHGRCIDGLSIGPSSLIIHSNSNNQQRGAFATKEFSVGDSITLAPVLPINRTILHTYQFDMNHPGKHWKLSTKKWKFFFVCV